MKRLIAFMMTLALLLAAVPGLAGETYYSELFDTYVVLPDGLAVLGEIVMEEGQAVSIYFTMTDNMDVQIITTLRYVPEYEGMRTKDLSRQEWEGWKEFFSALYPKRAKGMMIHPEYATSQKIFRFYGQNASGTWLLSYTGILNGLYVSTCSEAGQFGFKSNQLKAIFNAFNMSFELFAKSQGVDFTPYNPDEFEVLIPNLLYDDSPDSYFNTF